LNNPFDHIGIDQLAPSESAIAATLPYDGRKAATFGQKSEDKRPNG
jgi:hypothetical protein